MATPFPYTRFLRHLEEIAAQASRPSGHGVVPCERDFGRDVAGIGRGTPAAACLVQLLQARKAMLQAALATTQVADALRRDQKFARPGPPSPHIVRLRQQQAAARQASSQAKLALVKAAAAFVRAAGLAVPPRVAMDTFIVQWIESHVPRDDA